MCVHYYLCERVSFNKLDIDVSSFLQILYVIVWIVWGFIQSIWTRYEIFRNPKYSTEQKEKKMFPNQYVVMITVKMNWI